jgi:hypothetical protein
MGKIWKINSVKLMHLIMLIASMLFLVGFIFYAKPNLVYEVSSPKSELKNVLICVEDFKDVRDDKGSGSIGEVCNAFFKTGDVKEPVGVEQIGDRHLFNK